MWFGMTMRRLGACFIGVFILFTSLRVDLRTASQDFVFDGTPWFVDVTEAVGLDFVHDPGAVPTDEHYFMPQIVGSGAALFDFDNDGRLDLLLLQNGGPNSSSTNRLYRQGTDGRFVDVSPGSGLDVAGYGMGVAIGDINNDGLPDVLITEYGRIRLFLNLGGGKFVDITQEAGLENNAWCTGACFFDYDRDGWLDLVVVNYVALDTSKICIHPRGKSGDYCGPRHFAGTPDRLYHNLGRSAGARQGGVRFEDVTSKSGLGALPGPGLGVVCADFDGDGWPDIFVANDGVQNHLWINKHDGTFAEEALLRGVALNGRGQTAANMGIAIGDVSGVGLIDLFVTHLSSEENTLWKQGPRGQFRDLTVEAGLTSRHWQGVGWGTVLADFDQDGDLDLALVNGFVHHPVPALREGDSFWSEFEDRNQLFKNDGKGVFRDISLQNAPFCKPAAVARGLACGDLDGDGALDLVVTCIGGRTRVYRNVVPNRGHWLLVRAVDPALGGRDAYGAEVTVAAGGKHWLRLINPGYSYLCSNDPRAHFGLGKADQVDAIRVLWPDGTVENFPGQAADRSIVLRKGDGRR